MLRFVRRIPITVLAGVLIVAAFSTGYDFLFYLVYLGVLVVGGSYVVTRFGLADLEAGYAVNALQAHVGDQLRATYTLRNTGRLPKLWLEVHNPSTLPVPLPGRAISLGPHRERSWVARVPLLRRGHFRVDPLHIRTGDPFGFFEATASVGRGITLVVYPRLEPIPRWRLQAVSLEGSRSTPVRTLQTTPLATSIRPYAPGDSFNRIHWPSTARTGEIQVKEFDLEQTADVWIVLDLERAVQRGQGDDATVEVAVRVAAALAERSLGDNRAVGVTATGAHATSLTPDRGPRQRLKISEPPGGGGGRRGHAPARGTRGGHPADAPGHVGADHHPVDGPGLGSTARLAPAARRRLPGLLPRQPSLRAARGISRRPVRG